MRLPVRDSARQNAVLVAVESKPTTVSVSLYSFGASCYRHFPYRHPVRQAAGPLIENLPIVLTGDREPVDVSKLTEIWSTQAPSPRKTRRGLVSRFVLQGRTAMAGAGLTVQEPGKSGGSTATGTNKRG
jgi:hypothetical protein